MASHELHELQDELLRLKHEVPGLQLRKSSAAQSPDAPFPISCTADVAAPPDAERYDVASFTLLARISVGVLAVQSPGRTAQEAAATVAAAVAVEVTTPELPRELRAAMAQRLHRDWAALQPALGRLNLALLWSAAHSQFTGLITLLPRLLEPYQVEDASGSTVRRWAVVNDEAHLTIDASVRPAAATAAAPKRGVASPTAPPAGAPAAGPQQPSGAAALPRGLAQELDFLGRRYGLRLLPAAAAGGAAAAADQLAALRVSPVAGEAPPGGQLAAFEVALQPTDPAWQSNEPLLLQGWVAAGYPQAGSLVLRLGERQAAPLPLLQRQVLDRLLEAEVEAAAAAAAGRPGAVLRATVRYVENHAGGLWEQAEDIAAEVSRRRRQQQAGEQAQVGGASSGISSGDGSDSSDGSGSDSGSSSGSDSGSGSGSEHASDDQGFGAASGSEASIADGDEARGGGGGHSDSVLPLALQLEGLELDGVDALELLRLNLQVACARCRAPGELSFATSAVALPSDGGRAGGVLSGAAECGTCHADWAVELAPKLLHDRSNVLAHLRAAGCVPADLLPSMLAGQCGGCAASAAFRSVAVGRWNERACSACHAAMRFQFSTALFVPTRERPSQHREAARSLAAVGTAGGAAPTAAAAAAAFNGLLQLGSPLPDRGTCRHYRHSYRWLRFPCCGKRFACDLCHEELTDGHDMRWANRMVCGFCSLEQPVEPQCRACGKKLATKAATPSGRQTRFWEGGKGQRDPSKLHKDDPRRYRSKHKTRSAKSKRVGQEGKARRERAQEQA